MVDQIVEHSRETIRKGSKSFAAAARLFKADTRAAVYMLYSWCRYCDDLIDGQEMGFGHEEISPQEACSRLELLREQTTRALAGDPVEHPAFDGLQRVASRYRIPDRYPFELIDGFAMDVQGYEYRTLEDTLLYCYHVAGVVGVMMAYVMGVKEPDVLSRAADLGIAFQLTNISRDVMDDAVNGRVYLPESWLREAGVEPSQIALPEHRDAVFSVIERLLAVAERYYASAREGVRALGFQAGWAVSSASGIYRDIGSIVLERGSKAWDRRAVVSSGRKLFWALRGGIRALAAVSLDRRRETPPRSPDLWRKSDFA
ncbi:MAG TPA: phytoene/squalene synthase family protein [Chromatiales bacterium]|nr:phytoene/squalene synthase family protein [Chromatiales bacterium]